MNENELTASYINAVVAWSRCAKKLEVIADYFKKFEKENQND